MSTYVIPVSKQICCCISGTHCNVVPEPPPESNLRYIPLPDTNYPVLSGNYYNYILLRTMAD